MIEENDITYVAEKMFNELIRYMNEDECQQYSNVFNRSHTDSEVILLAKYIIDIYKK